MGVHGLIYVTDQETHPKEEDSASWQYIFSHMRLPLTICACAMLYFWATW